jgi:hypothetical protein
MTPTDQEIISNLKHYDQDVFHKLIHILGQKFTGIVAAGATVDEFNREFNVWLQALMDSGRPWQDVIGTVTVWTVEYDLPILPTRVESYDQFQDNYGKYILHSDWNPADFNVYYSKEYLEHQKQLRAAVQSTHFEISTDPVTVIKKFWRRMVNTGTTYRKYSNSDGSYTYQRILNPLDMIKYFFKRILGGK